MTVLRGPRANPDAAYIAAASPDRILALLGERDRAEALVAGLPYHRPWDVDEPHREYTCPVCMSEIPKRVYGQMDVLADELDAERARSTALAEALRFPRNVLIFPDTFVLGRPATTSFEGEWVAIPREDFDAARRLVTPEHDWHHRCDIAACNCGRCHQCGEIVAEHP